MGAVAVATTAAKRHLALVRVLARSFQQHHPDIPFFVALADTIDGRFDPDKEPFRCLALDDLGIADLGRMRFHYTQQELTYAVTPYLLRHLLDLGFSRAVYLKQESLVLDDLTPVLDLLARHAIVLTPHVQRPIEGPDAVEREAVILQAGVFNVGFLGVAARDSGRAFLEWWQDRLIEHCRRDVGAGMHFEQRWLEMAPIFFDGVHVIRDPAFNIGHWNLPEHAPQPAGDGFATEGRRVRFVRFSGFDPDRPSAITRYSRRVSMREIGGGAALFQQYTARLAEAGYHQTKRWPYAWDRFDNGVRISPHARAVYRELGEENRRFGNPFAAGSPDSFYRWFKAHDGPPSRRLLRWLKLRYWAYLARRQRAR
jgi:hypothetical protein